MIRPMKWHIYNKTGEVPLCWDDAPLEFDTKESAERFVINCLKICVKAERIKDNFMIKEDILYYDGAGYINAENLKVEIDKETGKEILTEEK